MSRTLLLLFTTIFLELKIFYNYSDSPKFPASESMNESEQSLKWYFSILLGTLYTQAFGVRCIHLALCSLVTKQCSKRQKWQFQKGYKLKVEQATTNQPQVQFSNSFFVPVPNISDSPSSYISHTICSNSMSPPNR